MDRKRCRRIVKNLSGYLFVQIAEVFEEEIAKELLALLASGSSHETGEGQVTCWYWWGKASCLKNRTAFHSLALPGSLSSNFRCIEIQES